MSALYGMIFLCGSCCLIYVVYIYRVFRNRIVFYPEDVPETHPEILEQYAFDWQHDGVKHHGWYIRDNIKKPLLVYCGGNAEIISKNLVKYYEQFHDNYHILALEYRGFGGSEGTPSERVFIEDRIALIEQWMAQYGYTCEDIILIGRSIGSGVAVQIAYRLTVRALILITPFDNGRVLQRVHHGHIMMTWLCRTDFPSDKYAPSLDMPGLCIIAGNDTMTPPESGIRLAHCMGRKPEIVVIKDALHNDIYDYQETWMALKTFLSI